MATKNIMVTEKGDKFEMGTGRAHGSNQSHFSNSKVESRAHGSNRSSASNTIARTNGSTRAIGSLVRRKNGSYNGKKRGSNSKVTVAFDTLKEIPKDDEKHNILARKSSQQFHVQSSDVAIKLTGGTIISKEGFLQVRSEGPSGWLRGYKRRYWNLKNGVIYIYKPNVLSSDSHKIEEELEEPVEEATIALVDIRAIEYESRHDCKFALVLGSEKALKKKSNINASIRSMKSFPGVRKTIYQAARYRKSTVDSTSRRSDYATSRSSYDSTSRSSYDSNSSDRVYEENKVIVKATSPEEAETWIQHLLLGLKNQAKFLDETATILINSLGEVNSIESLLRQSMDLYMISLGKFNIETANAQIRLADWLTRDLMNNRSEEAEFWQQSAITIKKNIEMRMKIYENLEKGRHVNGSLEEAFNKVRKQHGAVTALEEIQEETVIFGLSNKEHRIELSEVDKWKLAIKQASMLAPRRFDAKMEHLL